MEKEKQFRGDCSNLEEDGGPDRTLRMEQGDVDTVENYSCLEKDRQKCDCGAVEHSASVTVSPRVMGV